MATVLIAAALAAGQGQAAPAPTATPPVDPFEQAVAARTVADFARRQKDAGAMIVAARLLAEVPFEDKPGAAGEPAAFTAPALFAEAKTLAKGDPALLMQINIAQSGSRGVFNSAFGKGLIRTVADVGGRAAYSFTLVATGGQLLRIGAIGDLGTAMVIRLLDAGGRAVCVADEGDYAPVCTARPPANGRYRVEVLNRSAKPSRTVILSN